MFRFFRRRSGGVSGIVLIMAVCGILSSCGGLVFGVPASISRAREVRALPQPSAAEVPNLTAGTEAIFAAQISADVEVDGATGLALFYVEERLAGTPTPEQEADDSLSRNWERVQPPDNQTRVTLPDGRQLTVNVPADAAFMNSVIMPETASLEEIERRFVGYQPGQAIVIEGRWEGNDLISAETLYAGTAEAFVEEVRSAPGSIFLFSIICGSISFMLLIAGGVLRFIGR